MAVMTYDDLVMRLQSTLAGPGGAAAAEQLRARYAVVLVDEFQDTDPAQWEIMRLAFADTGATLVLIADPKQAIYAFRGADVYAYLAAAARGRRRATLPINWRSDQGLIDAHDALLSGVKLGHEGIAYRQVRAAEAHRRSRLTGAPVAAPLRIRAGTARGPDDLADPERLRAQAERLASTSSPTWRPTSSRCCNRAPTWPTTAAPRSRPRSGPAISRCSSAPIARPRWSATRSSRPGVPAVINGAGSVFATEPAARLAGAARGARTAGIGDRAPMPPP